MLKNTFIITQATLTPEVVQLNLGDTLLANLYNGRFTLAVQTTVGEATTITVMDDTRSSEWATINDGVLVLNARVKDFLTAGLAKGTVDLIIDAALRPEAGSTSFPEDNVSIEARTDEFRKRDLQDRFIEEFREAIDSEVEIEFRKGAEGEHYVQSSQIHFEIPNTGATRHLLNYTKALNPSDRADADYLGLAEEAVVFTRKVQNPAYESNDALARIHADGIEVLQNGQVSVLCLLYTSPSPRD